MKTIVPSDEFKQYRFTCPNCGWNWWFTVNQIKAANGKLKFFCDCGEGFTANVKEFENKFEKEENDRRYYNIVLDMLQNQGWSKLEAEEKIKAVYSPNKTLDVLLKDATLYVSNRFKAAST